MSGTKWATPDSFKSTCPWTVKITHRNWKGAGSFGSLCVDIHVKKRWWPHGTSAIRAWPWATRHTSQSFMSLAGVATVATTAFVLASASGCCSSLRRGIAVTAFATCFAPSLLIYAQNCYFAKVMLGFPYFVVLRVFQSCIFSVSALRPNIGI